MTGTPVPSAGAVVRERAGELAEAVVACALARSPRLRARYGPTGRARSRQDGACDFCFLADAIDTRSPALFADYVAWVKVLLEQRGVHPEDVEHHLACMAEVMREQVPPGVAAPALAMIEGARVRLPAMPGTTESFMDPAQRLSGLARDYLHALLGGYRGAAGRLVFEAAERGEPTRALYLHVFQPVLREVGRLWQMNRISVAQEHFCSAATQVVMSQLLPRVLADAPGGPRVVVACVSGDLHEMGARMVADFFAMADWNVYFCSANTPEDAVRQAVTERSAEVLAVSATMGCHLHAVQALLRAIRADARCAGLRVMVGGPPFSVDPALWQAVGADGTAADAQAAVVLAAQWLGLQPFQTNGNASCLKNPSGT